MRAAFLACDPDHAHDIALFEVGDEAALQEKGQVGLNHVAWRMASLDDLAEMYRRLKAKDVPIHVSDHTISIGVYFSDPDGNGLEVYYELPRSQWNRERPFSEQGEKGRFPGPGTRCSASPRRRWRGRSSAPLAEDLLEPRAGAIPVEAARHEGLTLAREPLPQRGLATIRSRARARAPTSRRWATSAVSPSIA